MARKRVTQIFPFLLPLRKWQRKKLFYLKMRFDGNCYAQTLSPDPLPNRVFGMASPMLNANSGFAMQYQRNKVYNLKLAARTIDGLVIRPGESFSFWQAVRRADCCTKYKDGLNLSGGKITGSYGGGLCQLSTLLFRLFLHTPMTVIERRGHGVEVFPPAAEDFPCGTDATVSEGWLDLKVRNDTDNTFQIRITFDGETMYGEIRSKEPPTTDYTIFNAKVIYKQEGGKIYQISTVCRTEKDRQTGETADTELYVNRCEIGYALPDGTIIEDGGEYCENN